MNTPAQVDNPFANSQPATANSAVAQSDVERSIQEVQAAMVIAKKFPRDPVKAMDRVLNACTRPTLAAGALYTYPRGGQEITGPSIRLAEAIAGEWGNMQFGIRELSVENGVSTVEAFAWDMETNTRQVKVFHVGHTRYSRTKGSEKLADPRDIYEMVASMGARRLRACILGVIPGDVTEAATKQCEATMAANLDVSKEAIQNMLNAFEKEHGVTKDLIERRIGKHSETINAAQMLSLKKIFQSLRDGMSKPASWFDMDDGGEPVGPKTSDLNIGRKAKAGKPAEKDAPTRDSLMDDIRTARTDLELDAIGETVDAWLDSSPENGEHRDTLEAMIMHRKQELQTIADEVTRESDKTVEVGPR